MKTEKRLFNHFCYVLIIKNKMVAIVPAFNSQTPLQYLGESDLHPTYCQYYGSIACTHVLHPDATLYSPAVQMVEPSGARPAPK
jgi:hypothetical protein